jgi:hypothetical protein
MVGMLTTKYRVIGSSKEGVITNAYGPQLNQENNTSSIVWPTSTLFGVKIDGYWGETSTSSSP